MEQEQQKEPTIEGPGPVNLFRPNTPFLRREVRLIVLMLVAWGGVSLGYQLVLAIFYPGESPEPGSGPFGFPFHVWYAGQAAIFLFLLIALVFNLILDGIEDRETPRGGQRRGAVGRHL